jgi:transcriptional regulator with XRE-family HTH domain
MEELVYEKDYLAEWRKYAGLTQEEVGAALGITGAQVSRIETGARLWDKLYLHKFKELINDTVGRRYQQAVRVGHVWELLACKPDPYSLIAQGAFMQHRWEQLLADMADILRASGESAFYPKEVDTEGRLDVTKRP